MTKYSTGSGGGGGDGDACELCGRETATLQRANVAGAQLLVCSNCRPHDDSRRSSGGGGGHGGSGGPSGSGSPGGAGGDGGTGTSSGSGSGASSRKKEIARKQAKMYDAATGDSRRWEKEGTNYEADRLPYLVSGYDDIVRTARQEAGVTTAELAAELDLEEDDVLAVEQGRAARAGVGGSVIEALAEHLDIDIVEE